MVGRSLITHNQRPALDPSQQAALTIVRPGSVPKAISEGILDLMTAFAAKDEADTDKMRLMRVYVEAAEGFDESVVAATLRHLKFHNPRNPWRPTPQDVYERCNRTVAAWERKMIRQLRKTSADEVVKRSWSRASHSWSVRGKGCPMGTS